MERAEFEKLIGKSNVKSIVVGLFILVFGVFIIWLMLSGADSEMDDIPLGGMIVLWALAALTVFAGLLLIYIPVKTKRQINNGNHPILSAMDRNDHTFIVWIYEHITQVQGGGSNHQIYIFLKNGKRINIGSNQNQSQEIIHYLSSEFPDAILGYSEENESLHKERIRASRSNNN